MCIHWLCWTVVCIACMATPGVSYPVQVLVTSMGKALLSPIAPLAEWAVRHYSVYDIEMYFIACADCGRLYVLSYILTSIIELLISFANTWLATDQK